MSAAIVQAQPYQLLPQPSDQDYQRLKDSIAASGGLLSGFEVIVDEQGRILDGHTRARACAELGVSCPTRVLPGLSEADKIRYVIVANIPRRHLDVHQKRQLIVDYLQRFHWLSDRKIATDFDVSHATVGTARHRLEQSGAIPVVHRKHQRPDQGPHADTAESRSISEHLPGVSTFELTIYFPHPSTEERTRHGLPYPRENPRSFWSCERTVVTPPPVNLGPEIDAYCLDIARQVKAAIIENPLATMLR